MKKTILTYLPFLLLTACYDPEPYVSNAEYTSNSTGSKNDVFAINDGQQICNPSVSQDVENYPASMLWLNFGTDLHVKSPDTAVYNTKWKKDRKIVEHDRLTISDTAGNVRWFMMRDTANGDCEFQDPEWSTHPNFIAYLRAYDKNGSKACDNKDYGIFSVRISDKKRYEFYGKGKSSLAAPHIWVDPSVTDVDTSAKDTTLKGFFGTKNVRLVYVKQKSDNSNRIVFKDFANGGKEIELIPPSDYNGEVLDAPLISPDGHFVVYNVSAETGPWGGYVQELSADSKPVKIKQEDGAMSGPVQPHWFKFGDRVFVVWAELSGNSVVLDADFKASQDGSLGRTVMREISLMPGAASSLAISWGNFYDLYPVPTIGGLSPDGKLLATGTNYGFMIKLP